MKIDRKSMVSIENMLSVEWREELKKALSLATYAMHRVNYERWRYPIEELPMDGAEVLADIVVNTNKNKVFTTTETMVYEDGEFRGNIDAHVDNNGDWTYTIIRWRYFDYGD